MGGVFPKSGSLFLDRKINLGESERLLEGGGGARAGKTQKGKKRKGM